MLTAIRDADNQKVIAINVSKSSNTYHCPDCDHLVILNKGLKKVHYFRHRRFSQCANKGESALHMETKLDIYQYLVEKCGSNLIDIEVEQRLSGILRADVYFRTRQGNQVAIEVQVSSLTVQEVYRRTELYQSIGIYVLWILPFNYNQFYRHISADEIAAMRWSFEPGYYLRNTVKFKEYELGIAKLTYNYLTFWDLSHKKSNSFYILKLSDAYGEDSEYYDTDVGDQVFFAGKRLKTIKSIKSYINVDLKRFTVQSRKRFNPSNSHTIPERTILLFDKAIKNG